MERTLYLTLLLIVVFSASECIERRFYYVNISMTWNEAQQYCRENKSDLATVNDTNDMKKLMESVKIQDVNVWVGLMNTSNFEWKGSLGDPVNYTNWNRSDNSSEKICAFIKKNGCPSNKCNLEMNLICYDVKESSKNFTYESSGGRKWKEAKKFCRKINANMASVLNKPADEIAQIIKGHEVWICLFSDSWTWSNDSEDNNNTEQCTGADMKNGTWEYLPCNASRTFVCHEDKLVLINQSRSWTQALKYCREKHVDLVSVDSDEIQQWVTEVLEPNSTEAVWVGLRHSCSVGIWFWVNGEIVCYENWAEGDPAAEGECDSVLRSGAVRTEDHRWISRPETEELNFICIRYELNDSQ